MFGARLATHDLHPIPGMSADAARRSAESPGRGTRGFRTFRMEFTPSAGDELQTEYLVDRRNLVAAYAALQALRPAIGRLVQVGEIRTIAADEFWMSPAYRRESAAIHFTWRSDWPAVRELLPRIEAALAPYDPRPHWESFHVVARGRSGRLPAASRLRRLRSVHGSDGKLSNDFLRRYVFDEGDA